MLMKQLSASMNRKVKVVGEYRTRTSFSSWLSVSVVYFVLESRLDLSRQGAKVGDSLQFIIRELDAKMIFQLRQKIERLQAVDSQRLKEVVIGSKLFPWDLEVGCG